MFFGVHNHTAKGSNQRMRDSINKIPDLIEYYHELGHKGLVITDHESISAHLEALNYYDSVKQKEGWEDFKLGLGNEIYLCDHTDVEEGIFPHFILIAIDEIGHKALQELSSQSYINNSFMNFMLRVPTYYEDLESIMKKYKGHLIGTSACLGGHAPRLILQNKVNEAYYWLSQMRDWFGDGYFFIELQPNKGEDQIYVNNILIMLSKQLNIPYIITTDAHYLKKEDAKIHEAYLRASEGDREVATFYSSTYVMSEEEIHSYMDQTEELITPEAVQIGLDNTMLIYDKIQYYSLTKPLRIPYMPLDRTEPDKNLFRHYSPHISLLSDFYHSPYDSDRHMVRELLRALQSHSEYNTEVGYQKVNECLSYLKTSSTSSEKMGVRWSAYLMQVRDYVKLCWDAGSLVGPGRGSGVGFCINYLLGITQIDPLREKTQTYPWRFLNPYRTSVLDIDSDVESSKREDILHKFKEVYGDDRVVRVLTYTTESARSAILTAARGLGISNDESAYIASLVLADRGLTRSLHQMYYGDLENDMKPVPEFKKKMDEYPELWEMAQKIENICSGVGIHAGGVIFDDRPITDSSAILKTKNGELATQYDLEEAESVSLIKIDLLSIDALDKIHETLNLLLDDHVIDWQGSLKATYDKYLGVYTLERDDPKMWNMVANHKILSLFQMEKESGKQALALVKPKSVDDLAIINSVIRLMAQEEGAEAPLQKYARFHDDISLWYQEMNEAGLTQEEQELLKTILGTSCGICESQEKFMQLVQLPECGGFDLLWADKLRKAVAKKKPTQFLALQDEFFKVNAEQNNDPNFYRYVWFNDVCLSRGLI